MAYLENLVHTDISKISGNGGIDKKRRYRRHVRRGSRRSWKTCGGVYIQV